MVRAGGVDCVGCVMRVGWCSRPSRVAVTHAKPLLTATAAMLSAPPK